MRDGWNCANEAAQHRPLGEGPDGRRRLETGPRCADAAAARREHQQAAELSTWTGSGRAQAVPRRRRRATKGWVTEEMDCVDAGQRRGFRSAGVVGCKRRCAEGKRGGYHSGRESGMVKRQRFERRKGEWRGGGFTKRSREE
eukprot:5052946-Pleurochrysis_carterae.AAC.2